jgi:hypothetical protein
MINHGMNLYITYGDKEKLKRAFLNLRRQLVIDSIEIIESLGYNPENLSEYAYFIVNEKIKKQIYKTAVGSKMQSIIYTNSTMDHEVIRGLINYAQLNTPVDKVVFLTEKGKHEELYELFEEVIFYPSAKKVHIITCEPIDFSRGVQQEQSPLLTNIQLGSAGSSATSG